jgi:hypothetical protein
LHWKETGKGKNKGNKAEIGAINNQAMQECPSSEKSGPKGLSGQGQVFNFL